MCARACVIVSLCCKEVGSDTMTEGMKGAIFLRYLWNFGVYFDPREDNAGPIFLDTNPPNTPTSKHSDIRQNPISEHATQ